MNNVLLNSERHFRQSIIQRYIRGLDYSLHVRRVLVTKNILYITKHKILR